MVPKAGRLAWANWLPIVIVTIAVLLVYAVAGHHPQLSRQEAVNAALSPRDQMTRRYAVKLVRESDLEKAFPEWGGTDGPDFYIWLIAVSGDYGIHGEFVGKPVTWGIGVVKDQRPAQLGGTFAGVDGNWPPFFDGLIDLR